jgi:rare lipoprotein A
MNRIVILILALFTLATSARAGIQCGTASWYQEHQRTATGARFDPEAMTAAHRTLPLGTLVRVTNVNCQRSTVVRITDRGPFRKGRIIDVSRAAARELRMINSGTARVTVEVIAKL